MGTFLSLSGVIGKPGIYVAESLARFAAEAGGGLQPAEVSNDDPHCCAIDTDGRNTTVLYPDGFLGWDAASAFLSRDLGAPVFSLHLHDSDLWMYELHADGVIVDRFNPVPDYWDDEIGEEEVNAWKGNATVVSRHVPSVKPAQIARYLVRWDLDDEAPAKAYPDDAYGPEDWQLTDFMRKLALPFPLQDDGTAKGSTYRLWTSDFPMTSKAEPAKQKPWWRFW